MTIVATTSDGPGARLRPGLAAASVAALVLGVVALLGPSRRFAEPPDVVGWLVGAVLVVTGAFLSSRDRRLAGGLVIAAGAAWHVPDLGRLLPHALRTFAERASLVHVAFLGTAFLSMAPRRFRALRPSMGLALATQFAAAVAGWTGGWRVALPLAGAALIAIAVLGLRQPLSAPVHDALWAAAGAVAGVELVLAAVTRWLAPGSGVERVLSPLHAVACAAAASLLASSAGRVGRDDTIELGTSRLAKLPGVIAGQLGVPAVELALAATDDRWLDVEGNPIAAPRGHLIAIDDGSSQPVALIATEQPASGELTAPARRALRLARDHARLRATIVAQVTDLEASRRRILLAQDRARSELRSALRAVPLTTLRAIERDVAAWEATNGVHAAAVRARGNLEEVAAGLDPVAGSTSLGAALRATVAACPAAADTRIDGALDRKLELPPQVGRTVWFAVNEALSNAVKHAPGSHVCVTAEAATSISGAPAIRVRVCDDGPGGADPTGSGLRGLADRVEALGGSFRVGGSPTGGTVVEIVL